eukprot:3058131-Amphidinium_carterae.1
MDKDDYDYLWVSSELDDEKRRQLDKLLIENKENERLLWDRLQETIGLVEEGNEYMAASRTGQRPRQETTNRFQVF